MTRFDSEEDFPPDIIAAFENYATPPLSRDFEAKFWTQFEARRGRYRGFAGFLRRLWEIEIEGVLVWRLATSMLSGGALCGLILGLSLKTPTEPTIAPVPPAPIHGIPQAPTGAVFAFNRRDWENELLYPELRSKTPIKTRRTRPQGGDFSWNGSHSSAHLA